jgi:hypothetical protein
MTRVVGWMVVMGCLAAAGCSKADQSAPATTGSTTAGTTQGGLNISFLSRPDPPQTGNDNTIEVSVKQPDGTPVTDAQVVAVLSMPAMPSMNMPAMRSEAPLTHAGNGLYTGPAQVTMAGTWNVAVNVSRGGQKIASHNLSVIAK